ncbi:MAG: glutamate-1-semialdehyde 2,1-aminomutase [Chlamydiia bacterium]|nr:glutamate-1-semialdehyde 2,1-aminomutase [Chlamydiia bacterium]
MPFECETIVRPKSIECFNRLSKRIPGGVNSAGRAFKGSQVSPLIAKSAQGAILTDIDGRRYTDFCHSWGALIHGHAHPDIVERSVRQIHHGNTYGLSCESEIELAEIICSCIPSIEKIRFVNSGTEATMSAIRLARGFTNRSLIIKFTGNYHGHSDSLLIQAGSGVANFISTASSKGVPDNLIKTTLSLPYNSVETFLDVLNQPEIAENLAGVILEPIAGNMGVVPSTPEFIKTLRQETQRVGALLIFDEVITGFRVGLNGAQGLYQTTPDLTCLGKIIGGGFPAAAFGGRQEIMDMLAPEGPVYQAGTLSGNPVAMEAGITALNLCRQPNFYEHLEERARQFIDPIADCIQQNEVNAVIQRVGSMFTLFFGRKSVRNFDEAQSQDKEAFYDYFRHLFANEVFVPPSPFEAAFISGAHTEEHLERVQKLILHHLKND